MEDTAVSLPSPPAVVSCAGTSRSGRPTICLSVYIKVGHVVAQHHKEEKTNLAVINPRETYSQLSASENIKLSLKMQG